LSPSRPRTLRPDRGRIPMRGCECRTSSKSRPFQNLTRIKIRLATNRSKYRIRAVEVTRFSRWRGALCPVPICDIRGEAPTPRQYLGLDENSARFGLGWILEQSPAFRALLVSSLFPAASEAGEISVLLQRHSTDGGYTDVELNAANRFHAILEASRFW